MQVLRVEYYYCIATHIVSEYTVFWNTLIQAIPNYQLKCRLREVDTFFKRETMVSSTS